MDRISGYIILLSLVGLVALAIKLFKDRKVSTKEDEKPAPRKAEKAASKHGESHGSGKGGLFSFIGKIIAAILGFLFLVWFIFFGGAGIILVLIASFIGNVIFAPIGQSSPGTSREVVVRESGDAQKKIEGKHHSTTFTYASPPAWIRTPPGYRYVYETKNGKAIAMQCTASFEKPSRGASGEAYLCLLDDDGNIIGTTNWWRPLAISPGEGTVIVTYRFKRA